MSLLQKITGFCSVFCLLGNYLSMWDPCFRLHGCLISWCYVDLAECFWKIQVYCRNLISLLDLFFSRTAKLDFHLWSYVCFYPKCYTCLCITKWFSLLCICLPWRILWLTSPSIFPGTICPLPAAGWFWLRGNISKLGVRNLSCLVLSELLP